MPNLYKLTLTAEEYADLLGAAALKVSSLEETTDKFELADKSRESLVGRKLAERARTLYEKLRQTRPYNS
jgi:hypothetical protein